MTALIDEEAVNKENVKFVDKESFISYLEENKQFGENLLQTSIRLQYPEQLNQFNFIQTGKDLHFINDVGEITAVYYLRYGYLELFEKYYCERLPGSNKLFIQLNSYINPNNNQTILMYLITQSTAWNYGYSKNYFIHNFPMDYLQHIDNTGKNIVDYEQESYLRDKTFSSYLTEIKFLRPLNLNSQESSKYDQDRAYFFKLFESYQYEDSYHFLQSSPISPPITSSSSTSSSSSLSSSATITKSLRAINASFPPLSLRKSLLFYEEGLLEFFENRLFLVKQILEESLFLRSSLGDEFENNVHHGTPDNRTVVSSISGGDAQSSRYVSFADLNTQSLTSTSSNTSGMNVNNSGKVMKGRRRNSTVLIPLSILTTGQREAFKKQSFINRFICFGQEEKILSTSSRSRSNDDDDSKEEDEDSACNHSDDRQSTKKEKKTEGIVILPKYKSFFSFLLKHHLFSLCEFLIEQNAIWITENNRENYEACVEYCKTLLSSTKQIEKFHPHSRRQRRSTSWQDIMTQGWERMSSSFLPTSASSARMASGQQQQPQTMNRRHSAPVRRISSRKPWATTSAPPVNDEDEDNNNDEEGGLQEERDVSSSRKEEEAVSNKSAPPQPMEKIDYSQYYDLILPPSSCRMKNSAIPEQYQLPAEDPMENIQLIERLKDHLVSKLQGFDLRKLMGTENKAIYR